MRRQWRRTRWDERPPATSIECPTCFASYGELCWSSVMGTELPQHRQHAARVRASVAAAAEKKTRVS